VNILIQLRFHSIISIILIALLLKYFICPYRACLLRDGLFAHYVLLLNSLPVMSRATLQLDICYALRIRVVYWALWLRAVCPGAYCIKVDIYWPWNMGHTQTPSCLMQKYAALHHLNQEVSNFAQNLPLLRQTHMFALRIILIPNKKSNAKNCHWPHKI
jgi:hypothetical protein